MVESHQVQNRGVEVVDMDAVFHRRATEFVRRSVAEAAFDSATGEPVGVAIVIMVAAFGAFRGGGAAELATPDDERVVKEPSGLEIVDERSDALVAGFCQSGVAIDDVFMAGVPGDVVPVDGQGELHHAHALFDEATGEQAALGKFTVAVEIARGLRFLADVEHFGH